MLKGKETLRGLFISPCLSRSSIYPYQSETCAHGWLIIRARDFLPVDISKLVMCWNTSLGCLQFVLEMHENHSVIFITDSRTRPGLHRQFSDHSFYFSKLELHCAWIKSSWDEDSENLCFLKGILTLWNIYPLLYVWEYKILTSCRSWGFELTSSSINFLINNGHLLTSFSMGSCEN